MKKRNDAVVCKQCGKIIVGSSKTGLCESCFNKDAGCAITVAGIAGLLVRPIMKYAPKVTKAIGKFIKK